MQRSPTETPERDTLPAVSATPHLPSQDGSHDSNSDGNHCHHGPELLSRGSSPRSVQPGTDAAGAGAVNADQLDEKLRRLSGLSGQARGTHSTPAVPGQRVSEYENALTPTVSRQSVGFTVIRRPGTPSDGTQLTDFPNEILTHILSHLHPDSHASVALVSKRFYALVTTPHAWQMAFLRHFPGQDLSRSQAHSPVEHGTVAEIDSVDRVRSESRPFARMTSLASWRSEYLLRTRLLRSVARGKPGVLAAGAASRVGHQSSKRASAVLTYNSKLPWMVSHVHAVFSPGPKKPPRAIHGSADLGVGTLGDPTSGKIEKWGLEDGFSFSQLDEVFPHLVPYGTEAGPAATLNVMDVSAPYGIIAGEGFPGGRPFLRAVGEPNGRFLGVQPDPSAHPLPEDIPKIPEMVDAICSVWIAKSSAVPSVTESMVGIMTGSTLGVVTAYSLGYESSGPRYNKGDMSCRWVLSPGVPIIALKVDDNFSPKRKSLRRVWAAALNALGEVYYLVDTPTAPATRARHEDIVTSAWSAGRTASWELVESTRRTVMPDESEQDMAAGVQSPWPSSVQVTLTKEQLVAEAREISRLMRHPPSDFRKVCRGWDMRRKLEVDFGGDDGSGVGGEAVVVISCGIEREQPAELRRYTRHRAQPSTSAATSPKHGSRSPFSPVGQTAASLFGSPEVATTSVVPLATVPQSPIAAVPVHAEGVKSGDSVAMDTDVWCSTIFEFAAKGHDNIEITAVAMDCSTYAEMALFEDALKPGNSVGGGSNANINLNTPTGKHRNSEIPGKRARMMAIGTNTGAAFVWNVRDAASDTITPVRVIHTESPEISSLAISSLYVVHGGSDGLVQAWDTLASTLEPIRTLNSRSSGRLPRAILNANPMLRDANHSAVGAIYLDPDPTAMRGVLAFGTFIRYWTYSSDGPGQGPGRKRRSRHHSDTHGRLGSGRRVGGTVMDYIKAEAAELRREQEHRVREQARLRSRFGVGLGDLTEEEAVMYAQMMSEESFQLDEELRRFSTSDEATSVSHSSSSLSLSGADVDVGAGGTPSPGTDQSRSTGTVTPDTSPAVPGAAPSMQAILAQQRRAEGEERDRDYERQIQQAIRLSLLEAGINDEGQSPRDSSSGEYEFQIKYKAARKDKAAGAGRPGRSQRTPSASPPTSQVRCGPSAPATPGASGTGSLRKDLLGSSGTSYDEDLQLALRLSLQDAEVAATKDDEKHWPGSGIVGSVAVEDEFPALEARGKGKGRAT